MITIALSLAVVCDVEISYTTTQVPAMYQSIRINPDNGTIWWPQLKHAAGTRLSNPNAHLRWLRPAGTHRMPRLALRRRISAPDGTYILVWQQAPRRGDERRYRWRFPVGTRLMEQLYDDRGKFGERFREKLTATTWDGHEEIEREPPGYFRPGGQCMDCHSEAGQHATRVRHTFTGYWEGNVRGGDTVFSVRPVTEDGQINPVFSKIVRMVSRPPN